MSWRCGVCEGVNQDGETCAICGASRAVAVPVDRPAAAPHAPPVDPHGLAPRDAPPPEPPRRRRLFDRLVDAAAGAVERVLTVPPLNHEPSPDPDVEPAPRRRRGPRVRPFPFGVVVTWDSEEDDAPP